MWMICPFVHDISNELTFSVADSVCNTTHGVDLRFSMWIHAFVAEKYQDY